jgi:transcriptional regulator with XRE-family HTH domain
MIVRRFCKRKLVPMNDKATLSSLMRNLRSLAGLSREDLGVAIGATSDEIERWENQGPRGLEEAKILARGLQHCMTRLIQSDKAIEPRVLQQINEAIQKLRGS